MFALLLAAAYPGAPPAIVALADRWQACHHLAGEEAYDAARRAFLDKQMRRLRCDALLTDERRFRRRYREEPLALAALARMRAIEPDWPGPPLP